MYLDISLSPAPVIPPASCQKFMDMGAHQLNPHSQNHIICLNKIK